MSRLLIVERETYTCRMRRSRGYIVTLRRGYVLTRPVMVRNRIYKESQGGEDRYEDKPEQVKHREERNRLRAEETKRLGHKPTGDVAHIIPVSDKRRTTTDVRVETIKKNRGWRKGQSGYKVPKEK